MCIRDRCREKCTEYAAVAHLVERHLAKVEVASSSLVGRSIGCLLYTSTHQQHPAGTGADGKLGLLRLVKHHGKRFLIAVRLQQFATVYPDGPE